MLDTLTNDPITDYLVGERPNMKVLYTFNLGRMATK